MSKTEPKLAVSAPEKPVLRFTQLAWEKIWAITRGNKVGKAVHECSSFGIMAADDPCLCEDIIVLPQINSHTHTEMDADAVAMMTSVLHESGVALNRLALWHH